MSVERAPVFMQWDRRGPSVYASGSALAFHSIVHQGAVDQSSSTKKREVDAEENLRKLRMVSLLWWSGATHLPRARWPKALTTCLRGWVTGQLTVEGLIESALLGRSKDPVLFHTGD